MNLKTRLNAGAALPYHPRDTGFGAPGLLRGVVIPRAPDDGTGGGGGDGGGDDDDDKKPIDPTAHAALAAAHERLKRDAKADRDALKELKDQVAAIQKEKEDAEHEAAGKTGDVEKVKTQLEARHSAEVKTLTERAEKAEAQVRKLVVEGNLSAALDEVRIKPDLKKAATAMLLREGIDLEDEDGEPVAIKNGLPLAQAIKLWAEGDEGKAFVLDGNVGGGAHGGGKSSGVNPWKQETFSLSAQDTLEAKNPGLAARLKAEAGVA